MSARVLVVDDDPWILRMVSSTLQKRGLVVDTAKEGAQALARARTQRPDLIISDVMMPGMDGWTFVQNVRSTPGLANIPIIVLTALGKDEARLRSLGLDPDNYLAKPFRFGDLEKRVNAALQAAGGGTAPGTPMPEAAPPMQYTPRPEGSYAGPMPAPPHAAPPPAGSYVGPFPRPDGSYAGPMPTAPGYEPRTPDGYPYYPPQPQYPPGYAQPYPNPQGYPQGQYGYPGYNPQGYPYPPSYPQYGGPPPAAPQAQPQPNPPPEPTANNGSQPYRQRTTAINGRLEQLGLSSLLVMMEMERKAGVLSLKDIETEHTGRIFLRRGQVVSARVDERSDLDGRNSVYEMLRWKRGNFSFNAMEVDMEDTVQSSTTHLLMEGARLIDEANRDESL